MQEFSGFAAETFDCRQKGKNSKKSGKREGMRRCRIHLSVGWQVRGHHHHFLWFSSYWLLVATSSSSVLWSVGSVSAECRLFPCSTFLFASADTSCWIKRLFDGVKTFRVYRGFTKKRNWWRKWTLLMVFWLLYGVKLYDVSFRASLQNFFLKYDFYLGNLRVLSHKFTS